MIKPTVGRVVWFRPYPLIQDGGFIYHGNGEPLAAIVTHVWNDQMVNLVVFDSNGSSHSRTSVKLMQDGEDTSMYHSYAEWMPYQKGQAAKTEQLEQRLSGSQ
jgi:hypothetical protein